MQKLSLSKDPLFPRSTEMDIKEWIRQTSAVAVAPDTLISGETRDTNSPTLTESSLKVGTCRFHLYMYMYVCTYVYYTIRVTAHKKLWIG